MQGHVGHVVLDWHDDRAYKLDWHDSHLRRTIMHNDTQDGGFGGAVQQPCVCQAQPCATPAAVAPPVVAQAGMAVLVDGVSRACVRVDMRIDTEFV